MRSSGIGPIELVTSSWIGLNDFAEKTETVWPSWTTRAKLDQIESAPRVTARKEIRPLAISRPLQRPAAAPKASARTTAGTSPQPLLKAIARIIEAAVISDAVERSMPPLITTKVAPKARIRITELAAMMFSMFAQVRKVLWVIVSSAATRIR